MKQESIEAIAFEHQLDKGVLIVNYTPQTSKCSWNVYDRSGVERSTGLLKGSLHPHVIDLKGLSSGLYQLCIIDGDSLLKSPFRIQ